MATVLTHAAIPLAAGLALGGRRIPLRLLIAGMLCSMLPDLDVLSFRFGIPYESPFGHRGWTHSLLFALAAGGLLSVFTRQLQTTWQKAWLFLSFSIASHGLLDAMTTGGLGVAFLWPLSEERFFLTYRFILVSPIGKRFFTERGWMTIRSELFTVWLPCTVVVIAARVTTTRKRNEQSA